VFHWVSSSAYRFALDPTPEQDALLRPHCGGQRYAFNWDLALVKANFEQRWAEKSYDIPAAELTPSLNWSAHCLQKLLNPGILLWLATAMSNRNASRSGKRRGPKVRFPPVQGNDTACLVGSPTGVLARGPPAHPHR
jgi:putative transposase